MSEDSSVLPDTSAASSESPAAPPRGFAPVWYLQESVRVARFDATAIRRTADDPRSLFYGMAFITVGALVGQLSAYYRGALPTPANESLVIALLQVLLAVPIQLLVGALSTALAHGAARAFLGATGRYIALLRVLWLASIVGWLGIIPVLGGLVAGVWSLLISLVIFEEIDGIERLQALVLVIALAVLTLVATAFGLAAFR